MKQLHTPLPESVYDDFHRVNGFSLHESLVFLGENGSFSHNLNIEGSDHDYIGVVVPPPRYVLVPFRSPLTHGKDVPFENFRFSASEVEGQLYGIGKFVKMLLDGNPNVVGLLWNKPEFTWATPFLYSHMVQERYRFASQGSIRKFIGFADSEIQSMTKFEGDGIGEKRRNLVLEYGYNTKSAVNAVRMMRTIVEFSREGYMRTFREADRDDLLGIKRGQWSVDRIRDEVERIKAELNSTPSVLPLEPDYEFAHKLLMMTYRMYWRRFDHEDFFTTAKAW